MIRVALVEDDADLLEDVAFSLRDEGLYVATCASAEAFDQRMEVEQFDVVVLDIGLPGEDGLSVARRLRRTVPQLGIIMLTARTTTAARIQGMEDGADVYLAKPTDLREVALVIKALSRRLQAVAAADATGLILYVQDDVLVTPAGQAVGLTSSETLVLSRLARSTGQQASRRQIIESFGAEYFDYDERRLETIVSRLRRKLEAAGLAPDTLRAVRGVGYAISVRLEERQSRT